MITPHIDQLQFLGSCIVRAHKPGPHWKTPGYPWPVLHHSPCADSSRLRGWRDLCPPSRFFYHYKRDFLAQRATLSHCYGVSLGDFKTGRVVGKNPAPSSLVPVVLCIVLNIGSFDRHSLG